MRRANSCAQWVTPAPGERSNRSQSNEWFMCRATLDVAAPDAASARIAVDSKYWLYVNGQIVVREGGLKRGPTPDSSYVDRVDLSPYIKRGQNSVAVLLWYFGRDGFSHRDSGLPGLYFDVDPGSAVGKWRIKRHPAYFDAGYTRDAYRLSENSVGFDARYDLPEWHQPEFDDSLWPDGVESGSEGDAPWGILEPREFGQWRWSELLEYESIEESPAADGTRVYECRLPRNIHFVPYLEADCPNGVRVDVMPLNDQNRIGSSFITSAGTRTYEGLGWLSGERVVYRVSADAVVKRLGYRETAFPSAAEGSFECSDTDLNTLWHKARQTLIVTIRDTFMDCPCRERAQWPGDLVIEMGQIPYCLDAQADLLSRKALREMLRWQRDDGTIYGPVPAGNWDMELPSQMLSVLSRYGIWDYYLATGDRRTLEELYQPAMRYLDVWDVDDSGLVRYRPGARGAAPNNDSGRITKIWDWIDWGRNIDSDAALNGWYLLALDGVRMMAEELDQRDDAEALLTQKQRLSGAVNRYMWDSDAAAYRTHGFEHDPDDRAQALMVLSGAAEPARIDGVRASLARVFQASPYMEKYVLEALFAMGDANGAIDRMLKRYGPMIHDSVSTLGEHWLLPGNQRRGSMNHAWSGGPLTLLSSCVAGLTPSGPGWRGIRVAPQPGHLESVSASVRTPAGAVSVRIERLGDECIVVTTIPTGTSAEIDLRAIDPSVEVAEVGAGTHRFTVRSIGTQQ